MKKPIEYNFNINFHGDINWYTLDCFTDSIQEKLEKLPISTYTVEIGNSKIHYFSWELPKIKDFIFVETNLKTIKEIRKIVKKSRYFNTSETTISKAKNLIKKGLI